MIEYHNQPGSDLVEIVVDGKVTREDIDHVADRLLEAIEEHGKLRVIEEVRSLGGIEPAAFWEDIKFGFKHLNDFSRCAVIGHARWLEWWTKICKPFIPCDVRYFDVSERDKAREWIEQAV